MRKIPLALLSGTMAALAWAPSGTGATPPAAAATPQPQAQAPADKDDWSDRFNREFSDLQQRMENLFSRAWKDGAAAFDDHTATSGFASSLNLSEQKDHYTVRMTLPDRDIQKVDVKIDPDNTLHVIAGEEQRKNEPDIKGTPQNEAVTSYSLSRYEQSIALPGPVDRARMKVDRQGSTMTITLPKAQNSSAPPPK